MAVNTHYPHLYYLEIGVPPAIDRSLAQGIVIREETDKTKKIWGYLIYQDAVAQRQRIVELINPPTDLDEKHVQCFSSLGRFDFTCLEGNDPNNWEEKIRNYISENA